jgi:flagellar protein FliS
MNQGMRNALDSYAQVSMDAGVASASPHRLIVMLYDGALAAIAKAKFHMAGKEISDIAEKGKATSHAISIIEDGLIGSLNVEAGGALAENLYSLYAYMSRRLLEGNLNNEAGAYDEVATLLGDLRDAWNGMEFKPKPVSTIMRDPNRLGNGSLGMA